VNLTRTIGLILAAASVFATSLAACASLPLETTASSTSPARPQAPDHPAAFPELELWLGEWRGAGWSMSATGERVEFDLVESVREKAGGTVLLVEGRGTRTDSGGEGRVTHDGLVLVYRDASGRYRWHGHEAGMGLVEADCALLPDGLQWSLKPDSRGTTVRFSIVLDASSWHEHGEVSGNGEHWTRFMEMTLRRVGG